MTTLGYQIRDLADDLPLPDWYLSIVTAFFFVSLAVNALVTALIVYRINTVYNDIRGFNSNSNVGSHHGSAGGQRNLYPLISILIESGLITFVAQLTQSIMYKSASEAFPLVGGVVVMLYVSGASMVDFFLNKKLTSTSHTGREFRRQLSLYVSIRAYPTIITHQGLRIRWILQDAQCIYGKSITNETNEKVRYDLINFETTAFKMKLIRLNCFFFY